MGHCEAWSLAAWSLAVRRASAFASVRRRTVRALSGTEQASPPKRLHTRSLFAKTSDLVQRMQVARRELAIEAALNELDHFDVLILDDLACVTKHQAETSALFELISARYETLDDHHGQPAVREMDQCVPGPGPDAGRCRPACPSRFSR